MAKIAAGLLMYRKKEGKPEVLLVHPGGPFYKNKDEGVWSIPKGECDEGETDLLEVAKREFEEETGFKPEGEFKPLGKVKNKSGKEVHAWAFEGDWDPEKLVSNVITINWPPVVGKSMEIPEVDRADFFDLETAKKKLVLYQVPIIEAFERLIYHE